MRINEAYEHEPLRRSCGGEDSCCPGGCRRQEEQCVDVAVPLILTPSSSLGPVSTVCRGEPSAVCVTNPDGSSCTVTFTQKLCISVPIQYGVGISEGTSRIACADSSGSDPGGCSCGCHRENG